MNEVLQKMRENIIVQRRSVERTKKDTDLSESALHCADVALDVVGDEFECGNRNINVDALGLLLQNGKARFIAWRLDFLKHAALKA